MSRLPNGWIAAALVITALALVNTRYQERRLFAESQRLERLVERRASEVENLEVAVASLKTPARLEQTAPRIWAWYPLALSRPSTFRRL